MELAYSYILLLVFENIYSYMFSSACLILRHFGKTLMKRIYLSDSFLDTCKVLLLKKHRTSQSMVPTRRYYLSLALFKNTLGKVYSNFPWKTFPYPP